MALTICFSITCSPLVAAATGILARTGLESLNPLIPTSDVTDKLKRTVRIVRPKVATDDRGRTVWVDPVQTAELELVTTGMLKLILDSDDEDKKQQIRKAAEGKDGMLAHDPERDTFEIVDDNDLQEFLQSDQASVESTKPAEVTLEPLSTLADEEVELSLVSTQMLRRVVGDTQEQGDAEEDSLDTGFDPYDNA